MNIAEIKAAMGITERLDLSQCYNEDKTESDWAKNWNNEARVMVLIPITVLREVATSTTLNVTTTEEHSQSSGEAYTKHLITSRAPVLGSF